MKSWKLALIFLMGIIPSSLYTQDNLVPNPSFEEIQRCLTLSTGFNIVTATKDWFFVYIPAGSVSFFHHPCTGPDGVAVEVNGLGSQSPHSGEGMLGLPIGLNLCSFLLCKLL